MAMAAALVLLANICAVYALFGMAVASLFPPGPWQWAVLAWACVPITSRLAALARAGSSKPADVPQGTSTPQTASKPTTRPTRAVIHGIPATIEGHA